MYNFLFTVIEEDSDCYGEEFFVECDNLPTAWEIASDAWGGQDLKYLGKFTSEEAEMMGLDTY